MWHALISVQKHLPTSKMFATDVPIGCMNKKSAKCRLTQKKIT